MIARKIESIQSHANFDGDSATGDRTQIRQVSSKTSSRHKSTRRLPTRKPWPHRLASIRTPV